MTDVEKIREALTALSDDRLHWLGINAVVRDGNSALDRLAARVGEGWCFDMERAPRNGSDILGYWKRSNLYDVICWNDLRETKDCWETSDDACAMSPPTCWMRITSPETTDG